MCRSAKFAVVLREAQWELDRVAFRLPRGEVSRAERHRLADALIELADVLRDYE
ncbi:hypothetical protein SAMN05660874_01664 [Saccharopolyspora flava]|uniref:Uncharacterized protein n=2 Tax=Saccharopolyspora flava TaxID=95161 RepID=A0A1I6QPJ4_9PSEU|nr:hypothetical protein SAMN05660874_01664 [Saccharopolyspora flava]